MSDQKHEARLREHLARRRFKKVLASVSLVVLLIAAIERLS